MEENSKKFKGDISIKALHGDHFITCNIEMYMLSHKQRMMLQKTRMKIAENKSAEEANFDFAMEVFDMFEDRITSVETKIYKALPEMSELDEEQIDEYDPSGLELIDTIDDFETIGYYDFSLEIYPKITESFGQGIKPGKKLKMS